MDFPQSRRTPRAEKRAFATAFRTRERFKAALSPVGVSQRDKVSKGDRAATGRRHATSGLYTISQATACATIGATATGLVPRDDAESTASSVARTMLASMPTPNTGGASPTRTSR